jgi:hypothetical protein
MNLHFRRPNQDDVLAAIRVAQHDLVEARKSRRVMVAAIIATDANGALNRAWAAPKEKRDEAAIAETY